MSLSQFCKESKFSAETFSVAFQVAPIGIALVGPQGRWLAVNKALCDIVGYTDEELLKIDFQTITHPEDLDNNLKLLKKLAAKEIPSYEIEKRYIHKNGQPVWILLAVGAVWKKAGEVDYYVAHIKDITQQKQIEEKLKKSLHFQELVIDSIPDLLFVKDRQYRIVRANKTFLEMYPEEERGRVLGYTTLEKYTKEDAEAFLENDRKAFETGVNEALETIHFPNGDVRTLMTTKLRFSGDEGEDFLLGIGHDITRQKMMEEDLARQTDLLKKAEQAAAVGHWRYDLKTEQIYWSDMVYKIHEVSAQEFVPDIHKAMSFYHPEDRQKVTDVIRRAVEAKMPYDFELRVITAKNNLVYVNSRGWPELDDQGRVVALFGVFQDITQRKKSEHDLSNANKELEKFAYIASHDLKAPLRGIDNLAGWISEDLEGIMAPEVKEKLDMLKKRIGRMEAMLTDILEYSRAGRIIEEPRNINLNEVLSSMIEGLDLKNFVVHVQPDIPMIFSPLTPLEQIFSNILTNAVKHHDTKKGMIKISFEDTNDQLRFSVSDDGPGIPEKYHEKVFDMFQTLKPRDEVEGSGLGMPIIKKLIELQGGKIDLESPDDLRGTTIIFTWRKNFLTERSESKECGYER